MQSIRFSSKLHRTLEQPQPQLNATHKVIRRCADAAVTGTNVEDTATTVQVFALRV